MAEPKPLNTLLPANINPKDVEVIDYENEQFITKYLAEEFPDIAPTAEDFFKGKLHAYKLAAERLRAQQEEDKRRERLMEYTRMWSAEEMARRAMENGIMIGLQEGFKFQLDDFNKPVFDLLCLYFTNDPRFELHEFNGKPYSLKKGIWLQSGVRGSGKSVLLKSFYINKRSCFGYKHTTELAAYFQKAGFDGIDPYIGLLPQPPSPLNFYQGEIGFMYDELFGEEKVNHMGSPLLISSYILNKLYDFSNNHRDKKFKFHCTSNADGNDIEQIAGKTFRSRMPDMFNLIKLDGPDRR
jgi:hypothetical protein